MRAGVSVARSVHAREEPGSIPGPATGTGDTAAATLAAVSPSHSVAIGPTPGVVKVPGVDDVLDALAREEDYVRDRAELFEGRDQTPAEIEAWQQLFRRVQREANKRLNEHQVHLLACSPNPRAFGAVFVGYDSERRRYDVTLGIPTAERRNLELAGRESFVRGLIDMVVGGTLAKRQEYLRRGSLLA